MVLEGENVIEIGRTLVGKQILLKAHLEQFAETLV